MVQDNLRNLLIELELRSARAATMNYNLAAYYDRRSFWLFVCGNLVCAVAAVLLCFAEYILGAVFLGISVYFTDLSKGFLIIQPALRQLSILHNNAASSWQALHYTAKLRITQMDYSDVDPETCVMWIRKLITWRRKTCEIVCIDEASYQKFNDIEEIFKSLEKREKDWQAYKQMRKTLEDKQNMDHRGQRQISPVPAADYICEKCGRNCRSRSGLANHKSHCK